LQDYQPSSKHYQDATDLAYSQVSAAPLYCSLGLAQQRNGQLAEAGQSYRRCYDFAASPEVRAQAEQLLQTLKQ
jgi:hypothetical protein